MLIGIIAEGVGDLATIKNVIRGLLKQKSISDYEFSNLRPSDVQDETDKSTMKPEQMSSWTLVKSDIESKVTIENFFGNENGILVVHLDSAERYLPDYGVNIHLNPRDKEECLEIREGVLDKINIWLDGYKNELMVFAIAVEETEAWVYPIFDSSEEETGVIKDPKRTLSNYIRKTCNRREIDKYYKQKKESDNADNRSKAICKSKQLSLCRQSNISLDEFCNDFETAIKLIKNTSNEGA